MNLIIALLLANFDMVFSTTYDSDVSDVDLKKFRVVWAVLDPTGVGSISRSRIPELLRRLPAPFAFTVHDVAIDQSILPMAAAGNAGNGLLDALQPDRGHATSPVAWKHTSKTVPRASKIKSMSRHVDEDAHDFTREFAGGMRGTLVRDRWTTGRRSVPLGRPSPTASALADALAAMERKRLRAQRRRYNLVYYDLMEQTRDDGLLHFHTAMRTVSLHVVPLEEMLTFEDYKHRLDYLHRISAHISRIRFAGLFKMAIERRRFKRRKEVEQVYGGQPPPVPPVGPVAQRSVATAVGQLVAAARRRPSITPVAAAAASPTAAL
ncbi:hypothetical protein BC828DRAFT_409565 [Blastocladiella britannica]|nr:hypothetical protein BC828DRAFT_409565 [Blastocladiella britannica]